MIIIRMVTLSLVAGVLLASNAKGVDDIPADILAKLRNYDRIYSTAMTARGQIVYPPPFNAPSLPPTVKDWAFTRSTSHIALIETPELINPPYRTQQTQNRPKYSEAGIAYTKEGNMAMALSSNAAWSFDPDRSASLNTNTIIMVRPDGKIKNRQDNREINYYDPNAQQLMVPITALLWTLGRGFTPYLDEVASVKREEDEALLIEGPGFCDMQRTRGRWSLKVEPGSQYLVRSARFFLESRPKEAYIELSNSNVKSDKGCVYPTSGEWKILLIGDTTRRFTFREVSLAAQDSIFTEARNITDDISSPRTTVSEHRIAPPKTTYIDAQGKESGQILKGHETASRLMAIPSRNRRTVLVLIVSSLLGLILFGYLSWKRRK